MDLNCRLLLNAINAAAARGLNKLQLNGYFFTYLDELKKSKIHLRQEDNIGYFSWSNKFVKEVKKKNNYIAQKFYK
jgi:hypothetical protein